MMNIKELELQKFIFAHPDDWEQLLQKEPYCFTVSHDVMFGRKLVMFKYSQIDTDWNAGHITHEARGIILDEDTLEVVSYAFDKFFNAGESHAAKLDAASMVTSDKIDGSIIKVVRLGNDLLISTNGTIDAFKAPVAEQVGCPYKSFGDIVNAVLKQKHDKLGFKKDMFKEGYTYIFELVSPWTRVVTPYHDDNLYLIGCRDNMTFQEMFFGDVSIAKYFDMPVVHSFKTVDDCLKSASSLDWTDEGYVIMDKSFNRVKCKNASWLAVHHLCSNHAMSYSRALEIVRANEIDEVVGYFPEFADALQEVKNRFWNAVTQAKADVAAMHAFIRENSWTDEEVMSSGPHRKDIAIWVQKSFRLPGLAFGLLDKKVEDVEKFFMDIPTMKLVKMLGYKE